MGTTSSTNPSLDVKTVAKGWRLVVAGYSTVAVGLVVFLTTNGASGIPMAATIGAAGLVMIGLLLPATGMLQLRRRLAPIESAARYGYAMQAFGLLVLLFGVVLVVELSSLSGYLASAVLVAAAGASAITGAVIIRRHFIGGIASNTRNVTYLILGTVLIFSGVGIIVGSNIAFEYWISQVANTIYVDIGATVSACGCVLAAYSFYVLHNGNKPSQETTEKVLIANRIQ
jgi:hypothetical protein